MKNKYFYIGIVVGALIALFGQSIYKAIEFWYMVNFAWGP